MTTMTLEERRAASEMLDALRGLREWARMMGGWEAPCWKAADAAIHRAETVWGKDQVP